jgi:FdhD protein
MTLDRARRPGPTVRTRVHELTDTGERAREDRLATEEPLEIRLAWPGAPARRVWVTMRTPGSDFELAAGWLLHEGLASPESIHGVAYCTDADLAPEQEFNVVTVTLASAPLRDPGHRHVGQSSGSSACGVCGKDSIAEALAAPASGPWAGALPSAEVVRRLPTLLRQRQPVFDRTGGVHAAGLATVDGELLVVREDVGRHNAVDKVTGARILAGAAPAEACLVVSGRAGFELVQKAIAAGVGSLVAVGAPTSLSARLASDAGLVLYGFTRPDRCVRYT